MLKLQYFGHLMRKANSLQKTVMLGKTEGKRRRGRQRMRWLDNTANSIDVNLSKLREIVEDRGAWWDTVHSIAKELDMTEATQHAHTCPTFPAPFAEETFPILHSCLLAKD